MLKGIDVFVKPREDLRQRSQLGGIVTLVAGLAAGLLFLGQLYLYLNGDTRHSLHLSRSQWVPVPTLDAVGLGKKGRITIRMHISFPFLKCSKLDLSHDGMSSRDVKFRSTHGRNTAVETRSVRPGEWKKATARKREPTPAELQAGCSVTAKYDVPIVGGVFHVGLSPNAWAEASSLFLMGMGIFGGADLRRGRPQETNFNTTHYIHYLNFGDTFPHSYHPLKENPHVVDYASGGMALSNVNVKLVPTKYQGYFGASDMFQMSVTEHTMGPDALASSGSRHLPGLAVNYDFTPIGVHVVESRDSFLVFLSSLISIVGGVFVTVSLLTGCLVHSAAEIAKKID